MADIIQLNSFRFPWRETLTVDGESSTLQVYVNQRTGEVEIVQMNDEGESIRTTLDPDDAALLSAAVVLKAKKSK